LEIYSGRLSSLSIVRFGDELIKNQKLPAALLGTFAAVGKSTSLKCLKGIAKMV
jgi:hypothetical protein